MRRRFHHFFCLLALMLLWPQSHALAGYDMTSRVAGHACDDLSYWNITPGVNGELRFTQSGRGSSDGSNMARPFPEYWISSGTGQTLDDAEIRHSEITGLPAGHYRLTLRIRCYDERGLNRPSGAWLYANGEETDANNGDGIISLNYNGQPGTYGVVAVEFDVASDGLLNFGINVRDYNATWVAWKDVTLECLELAPDALDNMTKEQKMKALADGLITDATFLIGNPTFAYGATDDNWEGSDFSHGGWNHYDCAEVWNSNFNIYQTLTDIPNGQYQFEVLGFYRYNNNGANSNQVALANKKSDEQILLAEVYANGNYALLQDIADPYAQIANDGYPYGGNYGDAAGLPYSMQQARDAFDHGYYDYTTVTVDVTNHQLTVGIRKTQQDGVDWTIWDDVRLTLLQPGDNTGYDPTQQQEDTIEWELATRDNPIDITQLIKNPDFAKNKSGWSGSGASTGNNTAEVYYGTCNFYQLLENLPDGFYRVSANGFYRYGDDEWEQHDDYGWHQDNGNNVWAMYTIPYSIIMRNTGREQLYAKLYANNDEVGLPSIFDYAHDSYTHSGDKETELGFIPHTQQGAHEAFDAGEYPVSLEVPVTNGWLQLGVRKSFGYKNDWACWSNFRLEYLGTEGLQKVEELTVDKTSLNMVRGEQQQLTATVQPATASDKHIDWWTSDNNIVSVDANGLVTARGTGNATVYASASGGYGFVEIPVSVGYYNVSASKLVINEIQVSNIDMFVDPSNNYGGYVELYNPTNEGMSLDGLYVSFDAQNLWQYRLTSQSGAVPARGYGLVWFDNNGYGMVGDKPDMEGGTIYISDSDGNLLCQQTFPAAVSRTSYARTTDGGQEWALTAYPTPGASNSGSREFVSATAYERLPEPQASEGSQLFTGSVATSISIPDGAILRYTTDGTTPTLDNGLTSTDGQFTFSETTVLRLRLFEDGKLPSSVKTLSYLKRDRDYTLPVLSIVGDPDGFYNDQRGIFVPGTNGTSGSGVNFRCNWNMEWERPVAFDYISAAGDSVYSQEAAIKRFGGWSRAWYPYNFKLKSSSVYEGRKYMTHEFFREKQHLRHKVLQVRNGGNDLLCRIKDASLHQIIMTSGFYLDCMDYQPVHVFVNGEYIGMENIREPSNKHFAYANYGIDTDEMDQMKLGNGVGEIGAGSADMFYQWENLSYSAYDEATYQQICDMVDVDEFANYMAAETFLGGDDWPGNNCKAFKGWDGKFHIVFFDVDQALRYDTGALNRLSSGTILIRIFFNMLQNDKFRRQFIDSYSLVAGSVFEPTRTHAIIDRMSEEMNPGLALEGLSTEPTATYMKEVLTAERRDKCMQSLKNWSRAQLGSATAIRTRLSANIAGARLLANGLPVPTGKFDGTFFSPMTVTAKAPEGYTFTGWQNASGSIVSRNADYTLPTTANGTLQLTATFARVNINKETDELAMPIKVNEVSAGNSVYANEFFKRNDWFELYNNTDQELDAAGLYVSDDAENPLKYQIPASGAINTRIPANGHLIVWADNLRGTQQLHANFKLSNAADQVVLLSSSDQFVAANADYFQQHPQMKAFVDGMTYGTHRGDESVGRFPDGGRDFYRMGRPTIERQNTLLTSDERTGEDQSWMSLLTKQFSLAMSKGWNWISHPLHDAIAVGSLSTKLSRISGSSREAIMDSRFGLTGNLTAIEPRQLYKVQLSDNDTYHATALDYIDPIVSLKPGWNWMGYPVNGAQTLAEALQDCPVEDGDMINSQDGFAMYMNKKWTGSLTTLETGKGYMYSSASAKTMRLHKPDVALNYSRRRAVRTEAMAYGVDKHAWPSVMGVVATLHRDGETLAPEQFTLLAYSGDECRGVAKWVDSLAFLTVYGQGGEPIIYRVVDQTDGTVYTVEQTAKFAQTIVGTTLQPVVLTLTDADTLPTSIAQHPTSDTHYPSSITGYYTMSGTLVARHASELPSGVYVARYSDGSWRKMKK